MTDPVLATLARHATDTPNAPAVLAGDLVVTYDALAQAVAKAAGFLARLGVRPDTLIGIGTPDALMHAVLILACEAIGAATLSFGTFEQQADPGSLTPCGLVLTAWAGLSHPHAVLLDDDALAGITGTPLPPSWRSVLENAPTPKIARVLFSSGTTSSLKLIALAPAAMRAILQARRDLIERFGPEVSLFVSPYGPVNDRAMTYVRTMLVLGRTVAFDFPDTLQGQAPPWFTLALPNHVTLVADAFQASALRRRAAFLDINGAAVDPRTHDLALHRLADRVVVNYGAKEATGISFVDRDGVGALCAGAEIRIEPDPAYPEGTGLIWAKVPTVANGYLGEPELTASRFVDGWFRTGDIGYQPAPDRLVVLSRADDLLNVGGEKLAPGPLEAALCIACDASAVALLTAPDDHGIERLCVLIERDPPGDAQALHERIEPVVAPHVDRFRVMCLPKFPRNDAGKILREVLRQAIPPEDGFKPPGG